MSVRCMVTWALWLAGAAATLAGFWSHHEAVGRLGVVLACGGMTMVILNELARIRKLIWRLEAERTGGIRDDQPVRSLH